MNSKVTSAGGLVVRSCAGGWEAILVGSGDPTVWRIPKGMAGDGETLKQTAVREVLEETGVKGADLQFIGAATWTYTYEDKNWDESAYFFLMKFSEGNLENHDEEFERVEWFRLGDAITALHYQNEVEIAEKALGLLETLSNNSTESTREDENLTML